MIFRKLLLVLPMLPYILHALGLEVINSISQEWRVPEQSKPVLRKSRAVALSRCAIHILPITIMAALVSINYRVYYIGPGFSAALDDALYLALYQVGAKLQEMLCVASLSTVVLQMLRNELIGDGVPIGLLGSGIWFSQISFVWSPEFLVAIQSSLRSFRKLRLCIFILLTGVLAAVVGPASAVLLIPRIQAVPSGGTKYFLNGTAEQLWPSIVTSDSQLEVCKQDNSTKYAVCPSGGFESIHSEFSAFNYTSFLGIPFNGPVLSNVLKSTIMRDAATKAHSWYNFQIQSPLSLVPPALSSMSIRGPQSETSVIQPHAATTISQTQLVNAWMDAIAGASGAKNPAEYKWATRFIASGATASPYVTSRCAPATNLSANATQAWFPSLYNYYNQILWADDRRLASLDMLDRNESLFLRAQWTPLPTDTDEIVETGLVPTGLLVEFPWSSGFRTGVACSVSAAWQNGTVFSDSSLNSGTWTNRIGLAIWGQEQDSTDTSLQKQPITLDKSWLDLLIPHTSEVSMSNGLWVPNTLEKILMDVGFLDIMEEYKTRPQWIFSNDTCGISRTDTSMTDTDIWNDGTCGKGAKMDLLETIIASMVADGLSRYGSERVFNVQSEFRDWTFQALPQAQDFNNLILSSGDAIVMPSDPSLVVQTLTFEVEGYAYYASTASDYLATSVAFIYIIIWGTHVVWVLCHGVTSSSWDTITELLVLCHNSPSGSVLKSASAEIRRLATYNRVIKVRASSRPREPQDPQVILVSTEGKHVEAEASDHDDSIHSHSDGADEFVQLPADAEHQQKSLSKVEVDKKYN